MKSYTIHKYLKNHSTGKWSPVWPAMATITGAAAARSAAKAMALNQVGTFIVVLDESSRELASYCQPRTVASDPSQLLVDALKPLLTEPDFTGQWARLERDFPHVYGFEFTLDRRWCSPTDDGCMAMEGGFATGNAAIPPGAETVVAKMTEAIASCITDAMQSDPGLARAVREWCPDPDKAVMMQVQLADSSENLGFSVSVRSPE